MIELMTESMTDSPKKSPSRETLDLLALLWVWQTWAIHVTWTQSFKPCMQLTLYEVIPLAAKGLPWWWSWENSLRKWNLTTLITRRLHLHRHHMSTRFSFVVSLSRINPSLGDTSEFFKVTFSYCPVSFFAFYSLSKILMNNFDFSLVNSFPWQTTRCSGVPSIPSQWPSWWS